MYVTAAGKSTFLRLLEEMNPVYKVISEPLTRWLKVSTDEDVSWWWCLRQVVLQVCVCV